VTFWETFSHDHGSKMEATVGFLCREKALDQEEEPRLLLQLVCFEAGLALSGS
jgi:hypothetical protein